MSKTLDKLQNILNKQVNNHNQYEGPKLFDTEQDYDDVHIIFGSGICAIAIIQDIDEYYNPKTKSQEINPNHYFMVFLVEDDDYWYIRDNTHYTDFGWINDYANVINKAVEYRKKLINVNKN